MSMRTIAVVVNYRTPQETIRAVRSLQDSHSRVAEIIVVDNGCGDGSAERMTAALPGVRLLRAAENGGFSAGCNIGIRAALDLRADSVLLLNSDAVVSPGTVGALEAALASHPRLGIVGPMLVSLRDPGEVQSLGISYSRRTGRMRHIGYGTRMDRLSPFDLQPVAGVSGCAMLIRAEVLNRVGLFAEEYFFGFEDLDFCVRASRAGFDAACAGRAAVLHEGSRSITAGSPARIYFATRNHLLLARRWSGTGSPMSHLARSVFIVMLNVAHVLRQTDVRRVEGLKALVRGVRDFWCGRFGAEVGVNRRPVAAPIER